MNKFHQSDKVVVCYCLQPAIQRQSDIMPSYKGTRVHGVSLLAIGVVPGINDMHCRRHAQVYLKCREIPWVIHGIDLSQQSHGLFMGLI